MSLALSNIKELLKSLRDNDWYITAFDFSYNGYEYVVVFEDLREIDRGTKYYAVMLTFIDKHDEERVLETYANSFDFQVNDEEIKEYFRIGGDRSYGNPILTLYGQLNEIMPTEYSPLQKKYYHTVLAVIDKREHNEGFCCYKARHNGKKANGEQIHYVIELFSKCGKKEYFGRTIVEEVTGLKSTRASELIKMMVDS